MATAKADKIIPNADCAGAHGKCKMKHISKVVQYVTPAAQPELLVPLRQVPRPHRVMLHPATIACASHPFKKLIHLHPVPPLIRFTCPITLSYAPSIHCKPSKISYS
eukprot:gene9700-biopygen3435